MDEVWGISGQRAVWIFIDVVVVLAAAGPLWRGWLLRRMKAEEPVRPGLTPHHLAYLSASAGTIGGPRRAVESAVAALVYAGQLRANDKGRLSRVGEAEPEDPFERAVFAHVRSGASIDELPVEVRPALAKLSDDLAERGLALRERSVVAYRGTILVLYLVLELCGFVWMLVEMKVHPVVFDNHHINRSGDISYYHERQFPGVAPLLLLGALMIVIWTYLAMRGKRDYLTQAGRRFVLDAIASWRAGTPGPGGLTIEGTAVVAIAGIVGYPDKKIASAFVGKPVTD